MSVESSSTTREEHTPSEYETDRPRYERPAWTDVLALLLAAAAIVLIVVSAPGTIRAAIGLAAIFVVPGHAILRRVTGFDLAARIVLTLTASTVLMTLVALGMLWTRLWAPEAAAVALLATGGIVIVIVPRPIGAAPVRPVRAVLGSLLDDVRGRRVEWAIAGTGLLLWIVSLPFITAQGLGAWGLLAAFPPTWWIGVALAAAVCIKGLLRPERRSGAMVVALLTIVLALYATTAVVEPLPRFSWTYKHINVVDYIDSIGGVSPSVDLYNRWPGFFAAAALLKHVLGVSSAILIAPWSQLAFGVFDAIAVYAIARIFVRSARRAAGVAFVFTIINWIGANYFSPQAFAFALYLTMCFIALHMLRGAPVPWFRTLEARVHRRWPSSSEPIREPRPFDQQIVRSRAGFVAALVAVLVLQAIIVMSHQLSPFAAIATLLPVAAVGLLRPRWLGVALVVIAVAYLIPNFDYIEQRWGFVSGVNPIANATAAPDINPAANTFPVQLETACADLLSIAALLLAAAGWLRRFRAGDIRSSLTVAWLGFATALILVVQNYGGEGRLRVLLFAAPWAAIGIVWFAAGGRIRRRIVGASVAAMLLCAIVVDFQPEAGNVQISNEIQAAQQMNRLVGRGDVVVGALPFAPVIVGANYPDLASDASTYLTQYFSDHLESYRTAASVEDYAKTANLSGDLYVMFSARQVADLASTDPGGAEALRQLEQSVSSSDRFVPVYRNPSVLIFELIPR